MNKSPSVYDVPFGPILRKRISLIGIAVAMRVEYIAKSITNNEETHQPGQFRFCVVAKGFLHDLATQIKHPHPAMTLSQIAPPQK